MTDETPESYADQLHHRQDAEEIAHHKRAVEAFKAASPFVRYTVHRLECVSFGLYRLEQFSYRQIVCRLQCWMLGIKYPY